VKHVISGPHGTGDSPGRVSKLIGSDVEVANFVEGMPDPCRTGQRASRLLLRHVAGVMRDYGDHAQDSFRKFLPSNGGCAYIDLDHGEFPIPEVLDAFDYVRVWHATLRIARQAMEDANEMLPAGQRLRVLINNSDGLGHSYGSHVNVLVTRRAFENIFHRKLHHLLYLAAYQASSIIITGQGKVGAENGAPAVDYQISQRADFIETLCGYQTTYNRPLVNSRDEPLCGPSFRTDSVDASLARLHVIFYDSNLCHVACLLKVGILQIVTAMIEAECLNPTLLLDDPMDAVIRWSHDPSLRTRARLAGGRCLTAIDHQRYFLDEARAFCQRGGCEQIVPQAGRILEIWSDVLGRLGAEDLDSLVGSLDWILKLRGLQRAMSMRPDLRWDSPQLKHLDHLYSSLDPAEGLYWAYERAGAARKLVSSGEIERFVHQPPEDTRAWTRAMLLRRAGKEQVDYVDWDRIVFKLDGANGWPSYRTLWMPDPRKMTKRETEHLFQSDLSLAEIVEQLGRSESSSGSFVEVNELGAAEERPGRTSVRDLVAGASPSLIAGAGLVRHGPRCDMAAEEQAENRHPATTLDSDA
jgi:proteasome accessory factor A